MVKVYVCNDCGNEIAAKDIEQEVQGSEKPVTLRPIPFCCNGEMRLVNREAS